MLTFYLDEKPHKNFAGLISGGTGTWVSGALHSVTESQAVLLTADSPDRCSEKEIAFYAHTAGLNDRDLSELSAEQVAIRLDKLYDKANKQSLTDIYLIACEAGLCIERRLSLAQRMAIELVGRGFHPDIRIHAIAAPSDINTTDIRVRAVNKPGPEKQHTHKPGDIYACTMEPGTEKEQHCLTRPIQAGSFKTFWNLPHNTFTASGPESQATLLSMQMMNALIKKRDEYEKSAKSGDAETKRKGEKHVHNMNMLIRRLQYQDSRDELIKILHEESTSKRKGDTHCNDASALLTMVRDFPVVPDKSAVTNKNIQSKLNQMLALFFEEKKQAFLKEPRNHSPQSDPAGRILVM